MSISRTMRIVGLALGGAFLALAQMSGAPEAERLVRLNVVAVDSHGEPIGDLKADDFRVTDDGKPETLALFHAASSTTAAPMPHQYTNRPSPSPDSVGILLDLMNLGQVDYMDAARQMGPALKKLESGEGVYLYILLMDGTLSPIHDVQKDPSDPSNKTWNQEADSLMAKVLKTQKGRPAGIDEETKVKKTYKGLEDVAAQLGMLPGRKDIIWVTGGVPMVWNTKLPCNGDWIDCALYVPHVAVTLERLGVTLDPFTYALAADTRSLDEAAAMAGGHDYRNDDLSVLIKRLRDQASGTYTIGYDPSTANWDSKFHKVKLTCERKDVRLQYKQRYYALPDSRPAADKVRASLVGAYQSPVDEGGVGLRATVSATASTVHLDMRVDAADVVLREAAGQFNGQLTVLFSARAATPQGDPAITNFDLHLTPAQRDMAMKEGIPVVKDYPIDAATQKIRVIIMDNATNAVGSLTIPISAAVK